MNIKGNIWESDIVENNSRDNFFPIFLLNVPQILKTWVCFQFGKLDIGKIDVQLIWFRNVSKAI